MNTEKKTEVTQNRIHRERSQRVPLWLAVFRGIVIIVLTVGFTLFAFVIHLLTFNEKVYLFLTRYWSKSLLALCGIRIIVEGADYITKDSAQVLVSNHSSHFDIPTLYASLPILLRIMYKRELERVPIFGWGLRLSPNIAITRSNARSANDGLNSATASIQKGDSVVLFPEGTRSISGELGEFKRGAFVLAIRSGKPIVPISILGSRSILPSGTLRVGSGTITVRIHQPIIPEKSPDGLSTRSEEKALMDRIRRIIQDDVTDWNVRMGAIDTFLQSHLETSTNESLNQA